MQKFVINQMPTPTWNRLNVNCVNTVLPENINFIMPKYNFCENVEIKFIDVDTLKEKIKYLKRVNAENVIAGKNEYIRFDENLTALGKDIDDYLICGINKILSVNINDVTSKTPLVFKLNYTEKNQGILLFINAKDNARQSIVFDVSGEAENAFLFVKASISENAELSFAFSQMLGDKTDYYQDFAFVSGDNSTVKFTEAQLGAEKIYGAVRGELTGYKTEYNGKTSYLGKADDELDLSYNIIHSGKKGKSKMLYNGVLDGNAKKTFRGIIDFRNESDGSVGHEQENVLLLNENVLNNSLPVILCEVEDLDGCHGASIGKLDEKTLFYLESRGIDKKTAEQLMVESRLSEAVRDIDDDSVRLETEEFIKKLY